jgi:[ribosomal protein S5]-alanine N-acetyltransferase
MIETERLRIVPLSLEQLKKYLRPDHSLETELGLEHSERTISPDLAEAFETSILPNVADPQKNYLYYTLWAIISKAGNTIVAGLLYTGEPTENGEVEIGYGTEPPHQNKGYMTEALGGMVRWMKTRKAIRSILAQTDKDNLPSHRTLVKNGFVQFKTTEDKLWWRRVVV